MYHAAGLGPLERGPDSPLVKVKHQPQWTRILEMSRSWHIYQEK